MGRDGLILYDGKLLFLMVIRRQAQVRRTHSIWANTRRDVRQYAATAQITSVLISAIPAGRALTIPNAICITKKTTAFFGDLQIGDFLDNPEVIPFLLISARTPVNRARRSTSMTHRLWSPNGVQMPNFRALASKWRPNLATGSLLYSVNVACK
jgi:hypothetical protein